MTLTAALTELHFRSRHMAPDAGPGRPQVRQLNSSAPGRGSPPPDSPTAPESAGRKRTSHACDRCRLMRTKCTGGTRCARCTKDDAVCVYGDHKRERNRKDLVESSSRIRELESENRDLVTALRQLTTAYNVRSPDHAGVADLLARYPEEDQAESSHNPRGSRSRSRGYKSPTTTTDTRSDAGGEIHAASAVGSPGRQGELRRAVNIDHGKGAAGFVGKMSEMSWMQRCREYLVNPTDFSAFEIDQPELNEHALAAEDLTYFLDDTDLLAVDEDHINPLQWPSFEIAIISTEACFNAIDGAFEFCSHADFVKAVYSLPQLPAVPSWSQRRWLALANLVWAIGSKWLQQAGLGDSRFLDDHLSYYARARALGLDHRVSFDHPDVQTVQSIGLLAFYLLINGSISRAWNTIGNAVRHAMSLGLHLKVSDPSISGHERHNRARTWFSLYKLQVHLAEITGRPHLVRNAQVTVPLEGESPISHDIVSMEVDSVDPQPAMEANRIWEDFLSTKISGVIPRLSSIKSHGSFVYDVRLSQLSEEVADQLFTGRQARSWSETQSRIESLQQALDAWIATLPEGLHLQEASRLPQGPRANTQLAMYACSIAMMVHRSCLCDIIIENESERSMDFNVWSARACVSAAISMLERFPESLTSNNLYLKLPWWTVLHYLCQSVSVLLLELCLRAQHYQGEMVQILRAVWKAMACLKQMTRGSMSAYRAWRIFHEFLRRISLRYGEPSMFDLNDQAPPARMWSTDAERDLNAALA